MKLRELFGSGGGGVELGQCVFLPEKGGEFNTGEVEFLRTGNLMGDEEANCLHTPVELVLISTGRVLA